MSSEQKNSSVQVRNYSWTLARHVELLATENVSAAGSMMARLGGLFRGPNIEALFEDARCELRVLRKSPGFTAVAVVSLALGRGANIAVVSVEQDVLSTPLPFSQAVCLVTVWEKHFTRTHTVSVSYPYFLDWQLSARSSQRMAVLSLRGFDLTSPGTPQHPYGKKFPSVFFSILGANLTPGRVFSPEEGRHCGIPGVAINDCSWRERFGRNPQALGKSLIFSEVTYANVGILPPDLRFSQREIYIPLGQGYPISLNDRTVHAGIVCSARIELHVLGWRTRCEINTVWEDLGRFYPTAGRG